MSICAPGEGSNANNDGQTPMIPGFSGGGSGGPGVGVDHEMTLTQGNCAGSPAIVIDTAAGEYVLFSAKETLDARNYYLQDIPVTVVDGTAGVIKLTLTGEQVPYAGIWWAAYVIYDSNDVPIHEIKVWLYIEKSINSTRPENTPLSICEVRLFLMDKCPEDNYLLDDVEFTDTEYMAAIRWAVDKWNETPPDVLRVTQTTCPWRYHWMVGAASQLLRMAAHNYARNSLQYSAGGVSVGDKTKDQQYISMSKDLQAEFISWMEAKKVEINAELCFGGIYSWQFYGRGYAYY